MIKQELLAAMAASMRCPPAGIVRAFRASAREDVDKLRTFVAAADAERIVSYAHRLKGASQMLGATGVVDGCGALEVAVGAGGSRDRIARAFANLEREVQALDAYLENLDA
jgi:HPt (histidine-containing phosphotransfer) domain-containing protein